jgi:porin
MRKTLAGVGIVLHVFGSQSAVAGPKDETVAEWFPLLPPGFNEKRAAAADKGYAFSLTYIGDTIGNVTGGTRRGAIYQGRLDLGVDLDLEKIAGWTGAKAHANMLQIHGHGLTHQNVLNLANISEIEALPQTRLYEAYIEQSFGERFSLKVGQQAADAEFFDSKTDDLFVNGTFGWPVIKASNLPAGGPSPPIAVMGARAKAKVTDDITVFAAIFNGNAAAPGIGDPQLRDRNGLALRVKDDPWLIGQVQFSYQVAMLGSEALPGSFTPGYWYHTGQFDDQRFTSAGFSIANPAGTGLAGRLRGNYGVFGVLEQTLYRPAKSNEGRDVTATEPGVTAFLRAAYSPPDRNLVDFYADAGIGFNGLVPGRPLDRFGIATAFMHISPVTRALDVDTRVFTGVASPVRSFEGLIEVIYEAHIKPGWLLAPYVQYIHRPSGGIVNPNDPSGVSRIGDALVFGMTTTLKY